MAKTKFTNIFSFFFVFMPLAMFAEAQCPSPTLTPVSWGSSSGSVSVGSGLVTLTGTGSYVEGQTYENAEAAYVTLSGNGQILAQLQSLTGFLGTNTVAGIFVRGGTNAGGDGGLLWVRGSSLTTGEFAGRTNDGPLSELSSTSLSLPSWLRIQNYGNVLFPSVSTDGANWTPMPTPYYDLSYDVPYFAGNTIIYGLIVWSGSNSSPSTAVFGNICPGSLTGFTPIATSTPTWTRTPSFSPTNTPTPSFTPTLTVTATPTGTLSPIATYSPTLNPSPTSTTIPPGLLVWPNPFTPQLSPNNHAHFLLPSSHGAGQLIIVDLRRRKIRSLSFSPGADVQWDGQDDGGNIVPSGVYLYLSESDGTVRRGTVTVMR